MSEAGGSLALSTSNGVMTFSADPTVGYFVVDNVELSGTFGLRHVTVEGENSNQFSLIGEPSIHLPINEQLYWFAGLGLGIALVDTSQSTYDLGLAFAPRGGVQILFGRSGLLNLGMRYAAVLSDVDRTSSAGHGTVLAVVPAFDIQAGYTVIF